MLFPSLLSFFLFMFVPIAPAASPLLLSTSPLGIVATLYSYRSPSQVGGLSQATGSSAGVQAFSTPPTAHGSNTGGARSGYLSHTSSAEGGCDPLTFTRGESSRLASNRKSSLPASRLGEATASSEERRDSEEEDDDDDEDRDDADSSVDEEAEKNAFKKKSSPIQSSQTLKDQWVALMNYDDETAKVFGPKGFVSTMKRWSDTKGSPFHRPREDPCISPLFDILKTKEKAKFEQNTSTAAASAAAGHAVLTAWDCTKSTVKELDAALKCFRRNPDGVSKESLIDLIAASSSVLSDTACRPLIDAASMLSSLHGKMISNVRKSVIEVAPEGSKSALREHKPADSFYFGNPAEEMKSQMDFELVRQQLHSSSSSSYSSSSAKSLLNRFKRPSSSARGRPSAKASTSESTSASSSSSTQRKSFKSGFGGSKRPFQKPRGGKGAK